MNKTRIEWADATWNPVTGCLHGCPYCYARRIAERFGGNDGSGDFTVWSYYGEKDTPIMELDAQLSVDRKRGRKGRAAFPFGFDPTFHRYRLGIPEQWTKPHTIFVCSMADLFGEWVPLHWIREVMDACKRAPRHNYLFLTKNPAMYLELDRVVLLPHEPNYWYGSSVTSEASVAMYPKQDSINAFWSIEPMLGPIRMDEIHGLPQWVIIGAETGNRKEKVTPRKEWIDSIVDFCGARGIPVFMKDSLIPIVGEENIKREFPAGMKVKQK